jgi:glycerol-3-phosphate acyltransferase PlsX
LAPVFPTAKGSSIVIDVGANPDCKPENLLQFAIMGAIYAETVRGVRNPSVGLLANGEEAGKGNDLVKHTYPLLNDSGLNFYGNIEAKELLGGVVDVAVTDGFTGNVLLKSSEAVAKLLMDKIKTSILDGGLFAILGGALIKPAMKDVKKVLDPSEHGAAPLLGVNGLVFIGHGRSDANAIQNAVRVAKDAVEAGVINSIRNSIEQSLK